VCAIHPEKRSRALELHVSEESKYSWETPSLKNPARTFRPLEGYAG